MGGFDRAALVVGVVSASLLAYLVRLVLQWRRLSHVPGPFWAAFTKGWLARESLKARQPITFKKVNEKYGRRLAINFLIFVD